MKSNHLLALFLPVVLAACSSPSGLSYTPPAGEKPKDQSASPVRGKPIEDTVALADNAWYAQLNRDIFEPKCAGCHSGANPAGKIDLTTYSNVTKASLIDSENSKKSLLFEVVAKKRMPKEPKEPLSSGEIEKIAEWIDAGAPEFKPAPEADVLN